MHCEAIYILFLQVQSEAIDSWWFPNVLSEAKDSCFLHVHSEAIDSSFLHEQSETVYFCFLPSCA